MADFRKWTDIESFSHVIRSRNQSEWMQKQGPIAYRSKIKLHGTNAGVRVTKDGIFPQSRSQIITIQNDNAGFAAWLEGNKSIFNMARNEVINRDIEMTFYGEWAGPGIQKGVSVSQIPEKTLFLYALDVHTGDETFHYLSPIFISTWLLGDTDKSRVRVLPYIDEEPTIVDFEKAESVANFAELVNEMVAGCETVDPYIANEYGIEGPGEGYVFYGYGVSPDEYFVKEPFGAHLTRGLNKHSAGNKGFMFKAKGEAHRVNKTKTAATVNPELLKSVAAFVNYAATEARFEQGFVEAVKEQLDPKLTGDFIRWVMGDILKECTQELVDNGLEWKQVQGGCAKKARDWYITKVEAV
jgi:hypothetical protein